MRQAKERRRTGAGLLRGALHDGFPFMAFTAGAMSDPSIRSHVGSVNQLPLDAERLILKGVVLEQASRALIVDGDPFEAH